MFSGIVECQSRVLQVRLDRALLRIEVERPPLFDDLKTGDSIAVNGVCLTVESFDQSQISFALGNETLKITGWSGADLLGLKVNLERSLRAGDRIHGHMVAGHVDAVGEIAGIMELGGSVELEIRVPAQLRSYVWKKGSWAVNGVSLTINDVLPNGIAKVCLIPETLSRTGLGNLRVGMRVNLEIDMMARALVHFFESRNPADVETGTSEVL